MSAERNREALLAYFDAFNRHDIAAIGDCLAVDVVSNATEDLGFGQGRDAYLQYLAMVFAALPDAHIEVLDILAEGDQVAVRYQGTGTHEGELAGIPASGRPVDLEVGAFVCFNDRGEIVEYQRYEDNLALMQQIGVLPADLAG
jgi:steroid delta-isomerase-like uncharacterized protein